MNPMDLVVALAGYGLLGAAVLFIGLVCLAGLLLGAMVVAGHVVRRWRGDDHLSGESDAEEERLGLRSFRWETEPD
ncbi:hypothetical protein PV396_38700 [Streptomyces sp. ME02-8801-2C]|uniref:hypothetical protein n=1 Tax=Streptomyces sp. ME02-8801-2C TaxID=3028680 RepID=UPI0029BE5641|nr:hypothetical protein [Streptomyces sp. ME02-8801-2C]MDX3457814.1 hypothetical protein [Streptomyces sp. ME02-8801-2C]